MKDPGAGVFVEITVGALLVVFPGKAGEEDVSTVENTALVVVLLIILRLLLADDDILCEVPVDVVIVFVTSVDVDVVIRTIVVVVDVVVLKEAGMNCIIYEGRPRNTLAGNTFQITRTARLSLVLNDDTLETDKTVGAAKGVPSVVVKT